MIVRGWHVHGFGNWCDHRIDDLSPGLNVLSGPNEVGKSTLHAFVRGVLYGFPDGRSKEPRYPPLRGGEHGGRLFVDTVQGPLVIARHGKGRVQIEGPGGERLGEEALRLSLGGTDRTLFRKVFAFGLDELASLDALSAGEASLRIFDAGLEGAGHAVRGLRDELRKRKEAELKARSGPMRELAAQVLEARRQRDVAIARARGHAEVGRGEAEALERVAALRHEVQAARAEQGRCESLLALWPVELRRRVAQGELARAGATVEVAVFAPRLAELQAGESLQADRSRRIRELVSSIDEQRAAVAAAVADCGPGWTLERLVALDRSPMRRAEIGQLRQRLERAERDCAAAVQRVEAADAEAARFAAELAERAASLGGVEIDEGALVRRREALAQWRAAAAARDAAQARVAELRDRSASGAAGKLAVALALVFAAVAAGCLVLQAWGAAAVALVAAVSAAGLALAVRRDPAAARRLAHVEAEAERWSGEIAAAAAVLGSDPSGGAAALERAALVLDQAERGLRSLQVRAEAIESLGVRLAGSEAARRKALALRHEAERALAEAEGVWFAHAADLGRLSVPAAIGLLDRAEAIALRAGACARDEADLVRLRSEASRRDLEVQALLREAGVVEQGAAGLGVLARYIELAQTVRAQELRIHEHLGGDAQAEALHAELQRGEQSSWRAALDRAAERVSALEQEVALAVERAALLRREREELFASADVPTLEARVGALTAELEACASRYRQAALLDRVLATCLERFQQERQPAVLRYAGEAFRRITAGRYAAVRQPADSAELQVVDAAGRGIDPGLLSRGAREQLYICVRLGLVRASAERGMRLPLLLDDVLVNFDPERADRTAEVLAEFASAHQVLLFTCHPETVARFARVAPQCRRIDLAAGAAPPPAFAGVA